MSEKHLTELPWKTLAQKHGLKDGTLQKALAKLMAAKEDDYDGRLKILKEIDVCCDNVKKANKANKEIVAYLGEIGKEADQSRITIDLLKKGEAKKAAEDEGEEGEDEERGLDLKGKLLGALKKVKMRKPGDAPVEALVCKAGTSFAVLMAKKVGASHKKELQDMLPNGGAPQFFKGTCEYGESDTYHFVLERLPGGAKKGLIAFLKEHTATNYKVQVRSLAGETEADSEGPGADPVAAFKNRLTGMLDRLKEAISSGAANGQAAKLKASEAGMFANKKDYAKAHQLLDEVETLLKGLQDAHGNVRELAQKEDSMVKTAITATPKKALDFQKGKFGGRMARISGMGDIGWDSMIGDKSTAFDVISQTKVFDETKLTKGSPSISYLTFQDSMYADEPGSREKLVLAFYDKKIKTLQGDAAKKLEAAVTELKKLREKELEEAKKANKPPSISDQRKTLIQNAFDAMGMKGVRPGVEKARNDIKGRFFLGKDNEAINRGRVGHTLSDTVIGFAAKAQAELAKTDKAKAAKLPPLVAEVAKLRKAFDDIQRKLTGFLGMRPADIEKLEDKAKKEREKLLKDEDIVKTALTKASEAAFEIMKDAKIGLTDKGAETGGGIGSDDGSGTRDVYKAGSEVFMGKNVNTRDDSSAASNIFRELGIPFTGGASGSTVDAVGGIVDSLLKDGEDAQAELKDTDTRKFGAEAEICMYIMGMHSAGHHSLVEMLYAAKQYPQKFFRQLRDPITDYIQYQENCSEFLKNNPPEKYQNKPGQPQLDQKALLAKRHEAMQARYPQNIISHAECTDLFMKHCNAVINKV
jgi:hypothetical protein